MAVARYAQLSGKRLELRGLGKQSDNIVATDTPAIFQIVGMHGRGDVPLKVGFIAAAIDLVAQINQHNPVIAKPLFQPGRIDKRSCRHRRRHSGNGKQERGQRHGNDATSKFLHLGLHEVAPKVSAVES